MIDYHNSDDDNGRETHRLWQHLYLAEIEPRAFIGTGGFDAGADAIYVSKSRRTRYHHEYLANTINFRVPALDDGAFGTYVAAADGTANWWQNPPFTTLEAYNFDKKYDDGIANKGRILSFNVYNSNCSAQLSTSSGADYKSADFDDKTKYCVMYYSSNIF